jgi:hypothetical protein
MILETEKIELAKAYVALSNSHQLDLIIPLFTAGAKYHSPNVGTFEGTEAIKEMMAGFFQRFPDANWSAWEYHCNADSQIQFNFSMTATERETGEQIERAGKEKIELNDRGLITRLEVVPT